MPLSSFMADEDASGLREELLAAVIFYELMLTFDDSLV